MQRIRSNRCNSLGAGWPWAGWLWATVVALGLTNSGWTAQDPGFQSPPLAPMFAPTTPSLQPSNGPASEGSGAAGPGAGFGLAPIQDPQVRQTDFQAVVPNGQAGVTNLASSMPLPPTATLAPSANPPPLANAIREFIEPNADKPEERTSASLFKLSALQLDNLDWQKMLLSLGVVIGGYLGLMLLLRLWNPQGASALPREVVEVLGTTPLNSRQSLQLVRLGSKLLLLIHGPEGTQSLGEISNPHEVEHLAQICSQRRGRKGPTAFRKFSENPAREPHSPPPLDALLKNLQLALQRTPGRTEYEA